MPDDPGTTLQELRQRISTEGLPRLSAEALRSYKREEPHSPRLDVGVAMIILGMLAQNDFDKIILPVISRRSEGIRYRPDLDHESSDYHSRP
ncbi:hypothetical protein [Microvirga tunisiensis]|uniref:Uncharacterized protein n=1 Tax=Microvirga tunisiensis TaxID=2108360 RepID=A0A5N7MTN5_9HYPH|nr:hypothetical protein [Microvirga tunisiensis]MPR11806.1 hypothetical protein [Microvirga tunisiensis]MPR29839.1 hypothetical protein [Microvirga tunisiensis]